MTDTATSVAPIASDYLDTLQFTLAQRPQIETLTAGLARAGISSIHLVGCGGSLAAMYPLRFLFEQHATTLTPQLITSAEFTTSAPPTVGNHSLVVVASHTGTTPETVAAARFASARGATVVAITRSPEQPLAQAADLACTYGSDQTVTEAKGILLYQLGLSLLSSLGQFEEYAGAVAALEVAPTALLSAKEESEQANAAIAARLHQEPLIYVLSAGPNYGAGYGLAMCYLQEMQWIDAASVNAGEFFHGAFEIVDETTPLIILLGEDATRPLAERALRFAQRYSRKVEPIDTRALTLPGVAPKWRKLITPLALSAVTSRLAAHFAAVRNHSLDTRRYMFRVEY